MSFTRYNTDDSVVSAETVVRGLWSRDNYTLNTFFTSSTYTEYYVDVYDSNFNTSIDSSIQFSLQFGQLNGLGSAPINPSVSGYSPSRVVYGQYRNLVYGTETTNFSFDNNSTTSDSIYIINISRARYKESLLPGSLNMTLAGPSGSFTYTDDSGTTNLTRFIGENRYFNIIQGTNGSGSATPIYGLLFPDLDIIVLNANALTGSGTPGIVYSNSTSTVYNNLNIWRALSSGSSFQMKSSETVSARYFFTRVKNNEYNYTTNPSIIDENGNLLYTTLVNNPQTYVTTVGMYNDNSELLAVAKLSKPLVKDFTKEALIRVKLDY